MGRRVAADREREADVRRLAHRQREACASCQRRGAAAGAHDDAVVLSRRAAGPDLDGARGRRPERQDLIEYEPLAQRPDQGLDRRPGADHAAVRVERRALIRLREHRQALGELGVVDLARAHAGASHRVEPAQTGGAERHDAVPREQLAPEPLLPFAPGATGLARELDQAPIVVGVAEDARLAAGLTVAGYPALVDRHGGALIAQRMRGREPDDSGPDHPNVGVSSHSASRAVSSIGVPRCTPHRGGAHFCACEAMG